MTIGRMTIIRPDRPLFAVIAVIAILLAAVNILVYLFSSGKTIMVVPWYLPTVYSFVALCAFCIAFLSLGRFRVLMYPAPFWIGIGYLTFAILNIFRFLVFPTLPSGKGIVDALPTTSPWLVNLQMATLAVCVLVAPFATWPDRKCSWRAVTAVSVALITLAGMAILKLDRVLPVLVVGGRLTEFERILLLFLSMMLLVSAGITTYGYLKSGDRLFSYTAISQLAFTSSVAMNAVGSSWYDLPFYLGRGIVGSAALIMLFGLLSDYVQLARIEQEKSRELETRSAELEQSEQRLRYSEATLRMAIDATGLGTFDFDPRSKALIWSDLAKRHFGLSPTASVSYELFRSALHEEDRDRTEAALRRALQPDGGGIYRAEYRTIGIEDGKERWLMARGLVFFENEEAVRLVGATLDITERKKAEGRLHRIFDSGIIGIIYWNTHGDIIDANNRFLQMLGRTREELQGGLIKWSELTPPEFDALDHYALSELRATGVDTPYEKEFFRSDGTRVPILIGAAMLEDSPEEGVAFVLDITDRKRAEEQLRSARNSLEVRVQERTEELSRALRDLQTETEDRVKALEQLRQRDQMLMQQNRLAAMGEMLVNISHQWRQPLNLLGLILQNFTRSYDRGTFTKEVLEKNVGRATELIQHMSETIENFSAYLNPDRTSTSFDVREVISRAMSMLGETLHGIEVEVQPPEEPVITRGYRNEYAQVVINILMNARDALQDKGVASPKVSVRIAKEQGKSVVTITDNAGGIPVELMDRIFEPYFTTKAPGKGTGIGLFMSRAIIEKSMDGKLTARNTNGGAEFRIEV